MQYATARRPASLSRPLRCLVLTLLAAGVQTGCGDDRAAGGLHGVAEDLWGDPVDLGGFRDGLTLVHPFSPANCGYCLFDGEFLERNYLRVNAERGGRNVHLCLFNPQLDIVTYAKRFRIESPILTFPPELYRLHGDGFPWISAYRNGKPVYRDNPYPYLAAREELGERLWPDAAPPVELTSPFQLANGCIFEGRRGEAIYVLADGDQAGRERMEARNARYPERAPRVVFESELGADDRRESLYFEGASAAFRLPLLAGDAAPVRVDSAAIVIGPYRLRRSLVSVVACFPNPANPERFVLLRLRGRRAAPPVVHNWVDFTIWGEMDGGGGGGAGGGRGARSDTAATPLLEGVFAKAPGKRWTFDERRAFAGPGATLAAYCAGGVCPAPVGPVEGAAGAAGAAAVTTSPSLSPAPSPPSPAPGAPRRATPAGTLWRLGAAPARFPRLAAAAGGGCWVTWAESGDILLAAIDTTGAVSPAAIERGAADSYAPVVARDGDGARVCYLSERRGFYRLFARRAEVNGRCSPELAISEPGPFDAVTPAVAGDGHGRLAFAWSEWRANQRLLRYRRLERQVLGPVRAAAIRLPASGYRNAWWPALVMLEDGSLAGAWNQHYPAMLGVCAGNLETEAQSVTRLGVTESDTGAHENGGYPDLVREPDGRLWVFWESFGWDVLQGEAQRILAASYDSTSAAWSLAASLSVDAQTFYNQTPRAAVDAAGTLWVVWSGRARGAEAAGGSAAAAGGSASAAGASAAAAGGSAAAAGGSAAAAGGSAAAAGGSAAAAGAAGGAWGVYLARRSGDGWSEPERLSAPGVTARAPDIAAAEGGGVWVAWHAGAGSAMRIEVLRRKAGGAQRHAGRPRPRRFYIELTSR